MKTERHFWFDRSLSSSQDAWFLPKVNPLLLLLLLLLCLHTNFLPKFSFPVFLQDSQTGQICSCFMTLKVALKETWPHIFKTQTWFCPSSPSYSLLCPMISLLHLFFQHHPGDGIRLSCYRKWCYSWTRSPVNSLWQACVTAAVTLSGIQMPHSPWGCLIHVTVFVKGKSVSLQKK